MWELCGLKFRPSHWLDTFYTTACCYHTSRDELRPNFSAIRRRVLEKRAFYHITDWLTHQQPWPKFPQSNVRYGAVSRWALPQISSCRCFIPESAGEHDSIGCRYGLHMTCPSSNDVANFSQHLSLSGYSIHDDTTVTYRPTFSAGKLLFKSIGRNS